jgi:hypothetical protein
MLRIFEKGVSVTDNYGATEVGAISTDGQVNFNAKVQLEDVPEMGLVFPRGEICVKCE